MSIMPLESTIKPVLQQNNVILKEKFISSRKFVLAKSLIFWTEFREWENFKDFARTNFRELINFSFKITLFCYKKGLIFDSKSIIDISRELNFADELFSYYFGRFISAKNTKICGFCGIQQKFLFNQVKPFQDDLTDLHSSFAYSSSVGFIAHYL